MQVEPHQLPSVEGVEEDSREALAGRYGHWAKDVLELADAHPALARRASPELPDLVAEAAFAAVREQARNLADVLLRRTRLGILDARRFAARSSAEAEAMAQAMAAAVGWSEAECAQQLETWHRVAAAEGLVPSASDARAERV
jgi:glycerol-3-phosphate dehydrogenase